MPPNEPNSRPARIKRRADFLAAQRGRRKWAMPGMVVQVRARRPGEPDHGLVRVGFTTSRKVGNAVTRNRARRRLRACADEILPGRVKAGLDIVLIGRGTTVERPYSALKDDLLKSLAKLDALADDRKGNVVHAE